MLTAHASTSKMAKHNSAAIAIAYARYSDLAVSVSCKCTEFFRLNHHCRVGHASPGIRMDTPCFEYSRITVSKYSLNCALSIRRVTGRNSMAFSFSS